MTHDSEPVSPVTEMEHILVKHIERSRQLGLTGGAQFLERVLETYTRAAERGQVATFPRAELDEAEVRAERERVMAQSYGEILRGARRSRKMTQYDLGFAAGIGQAAISKTERRPDKIKKRELPEPFREDQTVRIIQALGLPMQSVIAEALLAKSKIAKSTNVGRDSYSK